MNNKRASIEQIKSFLDVLNDVGISVRRFCEIAAAEEYSLTDDEIAFYRALIQNESAVKELGDDKLRALAIFVTEQLKKSTTVDWQVRDSVRAKLRNLIRRALKTWKYPPDGSDEAIDLCLQQAEALSQSWSSL